MKCKGISELMPELCYYISATAPKRLGCSKLLDYVYKILY